MKAPAIALNEANRKEESKKIPKSVVGYVFNPETQYTCGVCPYSKDKNYPGEAKTCKQMAPTERIKEYGSCILWVHMDPTKESTPEMPWLSVMLKEQIGYAENKMGFSCKRCEYFEVGKMSCQKVDKYSIGLTPGIIHPNACCNHWEPDKERAKKDTASLNISLDKN